MTDWAVTFPRRHVLIWITVALLGALALPASAQSPDGDRAALPCTLTGVVSAQSTPVPGVAVTIRGRDRTVVSTSTNEDGAWGAPMSPGALTITFELRGFTTIAREVTADVAACATSLATTMEVTRTSAAGADERQVMPRPSSAQPPVAEPPVVVVRGREASIDRSALRERQAAIARGELMLGADTWPVGLVVVTPRAEQGVVPPLVTRAIGVDAVKAPGGVVQRRLALPTISAQRLYSATTSYTVAGSALDAGPYPLRTDVPPQKPDYFRQSVDFTVGGPIGASSAMRSRLRTNATLSYSAIRGGNLFDQYATVPTAAMRAGDFSAAPATVRDPLTAMPFPGNVIAATRLDPVAQNLLSLIPLPNISGSSRNFHFTSSNRSTQDTVNLRLTRPLGAATSTAAPGQGRAPRAAASSTLNGQVEYRRNINDRLSAIPSIAGVGTNTSLRLPLSLNLTRRGTQHALTFSYSRNTNITTNSYAGVRDVARSVGILGASTDPFAWGIPALSFATVTGLNDLTPSERLDRRFSVGYAWSRGLGAHRLRIGGDLGRSRTTTRSDQNARGTFVFTGLYSGSDFADFLLGAPQQASVQYGPGQVRLSNRTVSLYAQDDWRRWSTVTLNIGVRYELVPPFTDREGHLANLDVAPGFIAVSPVTSGGTGPYSGPFPAGLVETDRNNVAPRVGAAWRMAARTTLRAGYGVSFNTDQYASLARQLAAQPPYSVANTALGTVTDPLALATALTTVTSATRNTFGVARDYQAGTVGTWTLDLNRDMGDAWNVSAGLTAARGSHLDIVRAPNRGPDGLRVADVPPFLWQTSEGRSRLRSATVRVRRWYVRGWSLSLDYTRARSMDNASTIGGGATVVAQDEQNLAAEWGPSSFTRRHQLSGDLNFELPFGDDHRWFNHGGPWAAAFGGMSAYFTFSAQTGTPLTVRVLSSAAEVGRGTNGTLRAELTGAPLTVAHPTVTQFFNTSAFSVPAAGTFGNAGRNLLVGPGSRNIDLQLTRDVHFGRTRTLSINVRAQNLLNLVNYSGIDTVVNSPTFGQVTSTRSMRSTQLNVRWKF